MENPKDQEQHEQRVRERAHAIWERAGYPAGLEAEHWSEAKRELQDELGGDLAPMPDGEPALRDEAPAGKEPAVAKSDKPAPAVPGRNNETPAQPAGEKAATPSGRRASVG